VEKYCTVGHTTGKNTAHVHCMLYTEGYKHTFKMCNKYGFSTKTVVARTRLNFTLYVRCLTCMYTLPNLYVYVAWFQNVFLI